MSSLNKRGIRLVFTLDAAYSQDDVRSQAQNLLDVILGAVDVAPVTSAKASHEVALCA
jgi:hypothetical protein